MKEFSNWKNSNLLLGLSNENLSLLATALNVEQFNDGDFIIRDGEEGNKLYIIESGNVQILKQGILLAEKGVSEHFGVMALLDDSKRSADVRAKGEVMVMTTTIDQIKSNSTSDIYINIVSNHLKEIQGELRKMNHSSVAEIKEKLRVITEAVESIKTRISSDLHDDVGTILAGIAMQSELLSLSLSDQQKAEMQEMSEMSRDAMERMRDIVWSMDSKKDKYENLLDKMRDYAKNKLGRSSFSYKFEVDGVEGSEIINPDVRKNLYLIFKEALTNIFKHSKGDKVVIQLTKDVKGLLLSIHDNGPFSEIAKTEGMGLSNMKMRAEKLGGTFSIDREDGFGVRVLI